MNKEDFLTHHDAICEQARRLVEEKISGYSGDDLSVFTNFMKVEDLGICSMQTGLLARIADKLGRAITYANTEGELVGEERFEDCILDLLNYIIFLSLSSRGSNREQ